MEIPSSTRDRLAYVLDHQAHCDLYLPRIADPAGKSVLVVGSGAGTEMLWSLRMGAREVVGIDLLPQDPEALRLAAARVGIPADRRWEMRRLDIEEAAALGRRFDLVLSNNVFEHVADVAAAFSACAALVEPGRGRIAVFTDPLYHSSTGSHLPLPPWEHLWEPGRLAPQDQIPLNRMRLGDFLEAVRASGLVLLTLGVLPDRHLAALPARLARDGGAGSAPGALPGVAVADLAVEGIYAELLRLPEGEAEPAPADLLPTEAVRGFAERALAGRVSQLYADTGGGFSQGRCATAPVDPDAERFALAFDLSGFSGVRALRWDPLENRLCTLALAEAAWEDRAGRLHPLDPAAARSNGEPAPDGGFAFHTLDPMILFDLPGGAEPVALRLAGTWQVHDTERVLADLFGKARELAVVRAGRERAEAQLTALQASTSWRLGRFLTAPVRKLREARRERAR